MLHKSKKQGFSLIEMVVYVSVLSVISVLLINMLISITSTYRTVVALRIAEHSGIDSMERMTRDIRGAISVDTANSILGTSPGVLTLVSTYSGVSTTTKFYVDSGVLKVDVNGTYLGPLTLADTSVTNLVFNLLDNGVSQAVKIDITISGTVGVINKSKTYHTTVVLKGI